MDVRTHGKLMISGHPNSKAKLLRRTDRPLLAGTSEVDFYNHVISICFWRYSGRGRACCTKLTSKKLTTDIVSGVGPPGWTRLLIIAIIQHSQFWTASSLHQLISAIDSYCSR